MSFFAQKRHSVAPSSFPPASGLASSQVTRRVQFPNNSQSQSHLQSPQEKQQSRPVCPWSSHASPFEQSPSPFLRHYHALSTSATAVGELFLFGGFVYKSRSPSNDLYVISTQDFSTTLLQTSGDIPSPRFGHCAVLISTTLLVWGGTTDFSDQNPQNQSDDDHFYLLNLVSREWTRIVVHGPGPGCRYYHTMTLIGSKLFVFGGRTTNKRLNDIWALNLNYLKSNPFWESYDPPPVPGNEKPLPRSAHVSVTTGDRIIIFGGRGDPHHVFNDTWSFNILTRKWTELQCTGSIPSPRASHAAILIDDVIYVFGGRAGNGTSLGDLTAFNLLTQRWIAFQDIGSSPSGRFGHAMACDGTCVFVIGGVLSRGASADKSKPIHVLDTKYLDYPELVAVDPGEKTSQLVKNSSASSPTRGQPHQPSFSSSDTHPAHGASSFQKATPEEQDHPTSQKITHKHNSDLNGLPSRPTGASGSPRRLPKEGDDGEGSTEHHAKFVTTDAPSGKEIVSLEDGRLIELERQLSETLVAKTERDRRIAQLTDELALKNALLEQAKANAAEEKKRAGLEFRELQVKFDDLLLSRDHALEQAQSTLRGAYCTIEANEQSQRDLTEIHAEIKASESESPAFRLRLADTENGYARNEADPDTYHNQTTTGLVNTDDNRVMHRLMERMQAMEAEIASLRWNEKSFERMECRNEG